jgi:hypothetical protein
MSAPKFDKNKFNQEFNSMKGKQKSSKPIKTEKKQKDTSILNLKIEQILINTKNAVFDMIEDILSGNIGMKTFTKNDRLFYLGSMVLFFALALCIIDFIIGPSSESSLNYATDKPQFEMHHIHHIVGNSNKPELPLAAMINQPFPELPEFKMDFFSKQNTPAPASKTVPASGTTQAPTTTNPTISTTPKKSTNKK